MYEWLTGAVCESSQVITANRRLARVLTNVYCQQQLELGHSAWRSPPIRSWQDWLGDLYTVAELASVLPIRINSHQSRVLWERCLRREVADPLLNMPMLVRQARESWARLHDFEVPLAVCTESATGRDQNIFARAANGYRSILEAEGWVDEAGIAEKVVAGIRNGAAPVPARVTLAGFDRLTPQVETVLDTLRSAEVTVDVVSGQSGAGFANIQSYDNADAEMRAAGAWARRQLQESPDRIVGIVATHLEQDAERCARLVREGLVPGWQYAGEIYENAVNVSYGSSLGEYPAIAIALLSLRWLRDDLAGRDVSTLLRSPAIGAWPGGGRSRLELHLRRHPDRHWSPAMILGLFRGREEGPDARDWLQRVSSIDAARQQLPQRAAPSEWVVSFDDMLEALNWPGEQPLNSHEFQLVNRWRELLNDFARLRLVSASMSAGEALRRLGAMAGETVFQPESDGAIVQLLGPLEAAGMEFDRLWVSGLSASSWPPPGRPSVLLSRRLQQSYGMPDADPDDTLAYAMRVLARLAASASEVKGSFALTDADAEQTVSGLLDNDPVGVEASASDPGWHAAEMVTMASSKVVASDPVPPVLDNESITGGASTINHQIHEPFSAFCYGRLAVRPLAGIASGLAAGLRGSLIHDALRNLYSERPSQVEIASWDEEQRCKRIDAALHGVFHKQDRYADPVLRCLLQLERQRNASLLHAVVELDVTRTPFSVLDVEAALETAIEGIRLRLRIDRVDRIDDGGLVILDYKTGAKKAFRSRDGLPNDMQLVVYALAVSEPVAGLGLINVDSRAVDINGAGSDFTPDLDWDETLANWKSEVSDAAHEIRRGDVRINGLLDRRGSRPLSLLSRIAELRRDD